MRLSCHCQNERYGQLKIRLLRAQRSGQQSIFLRRQDLEPYMLLSLIDSGKETIGEYVAFSPVRPVARIDVETSDLPCKVGRLSKKMADYYRAVLVRQSKIFPW